MRQKTAVLARGKWKSILSEIGIDKSFLTGKHGPCPVCGGDDRFRFDDKDGNGTYYCSQCKPGSGTTLVMKYLGVDFREACRRIDRVIGVIREDVNKIENANTHNRISSEDAMNIIRKMYGNSIAITKKNPAHGYFSNRGLSIDEYPDVVRFIAKSPDANKVLRPAIVSFMAAPGREGFVNAQRTFLRDDCLSKADLPKKDQRAFGPSPIPEGSCVQLFPYDGGPLGIAEGIETAFAASELFGIPVWAALTSSILAKWVPPEGCTDIYIFGDNDVPKGPSNNRAGQEAAYTLANRLAIKGIFASIRIPEKEGYDWLDVLNEKKAEEQSFEKEKAPHNGGSVKSQKTSDKPMNVKNGKSDKVDAGIHKHDPAPSNLQHNPKDATMEHTINTNTTIDANFDGCIEPQINRPCQHKFLWPIKCKNGTLVSKSPENVKYFLDVFGVELSYDKYSNNYISRIDGKKSIVDDEVERRLWAESLKVGLKETKEFFCDMLEDIAMRNSFNPVEEYLDRVEREWDGIDRIDQWLSTYMGADDTRLNGAFGAKHLIAAVRRVRDPGSKYDTMLVLEGGQGRGKSSCIRQLCPNDSLFTDSLKIGADSKETIEATQGVWHVEIAELDGMGKRDANSIKAMISRQIDASRLSYGRLQARRPRQFVLWGTCNDAQYLRDQTGNRRFWPVRVGDRIDPTEAIKAIIRDRDLLWGEAAYRERRGESVDLPDDLRSLASEAQDERVIIDPWSEIIEAKLGTKTKVYTDAIYEWLDVATEKRNPMISQRIATIMNSIGYERKRLRIDGSRRYIYEKKDLEV